MKVVGSIARRCASSVPPQRSRIPHLQYHISQKARRLRLDHDSYPHPFASSLIPVRTKATATRRTGQKQLPNGRQTQSASAPDPSFRPFQSRNDPEDEQAEDAYVQGPADPGQVSDVEKFIRERSPEQLLDWMLNTEQGRSFIGTAPDSLFVPAFCAIDPEVFIEPFKLALKFNTGPIDYDLMARVRDFVHRVGRVFGRRRRSQPVVLAVYAHNLKCAAAAGDLKTVLSQWAQMLDTSKHEPDIACYNAFLAAFNWNLGYNRAAMSQWRNTDRNVAFRKKLPRPKPLLGYNLDDTDPMAIRPRVLEIFRKISAKGFQANEETYTNMLIAFARCGDLDSAQSILKSVWNVDLAALDSFDEEEVESPTFYDEQHPLRPSEKLLFAVVHGFCINHQVPTAERLLDYISRNYALTIPTYVWEELFTWTYVCCINKSAAKEEQGQARGQLDPRQLERLFARITDAPYNLRPTPGMISLLTRNFRQRSSLAKCLTMLRQTELLLNEDLDHVDAARTALLTAVESPHESFDNDNGILTERFIDLRHAFRMAFLQAKQQHHLFTGELARILCRREGFYGLCTEWPRQRLPDFIEEFREHLHGHYEYRLRDMNGEVTGTVSIKLPKYEPDAVHSYKFIKECQQLFTDLDTDDLSQIAAKLPELVPRMNEASHALSHELWDPVARKPPKKTHAQVRKTSGDTAAWSPVFDEDVHTPYIA